jgi:conjugative transposon TraM protein
MSRIRINQPKYIIPLILIPFNLFLFYMLKDYIGKGQEQETEAQEVNSINTDIPLPNLERRPLKNKFESFKDAFAYSRDFSAMQDIDLQEEENPTLSEHDHHLVDSINNSLLLGTRKDFMSQVNERTRNTYPNPIPTRTIAKTETAYDQEMRIFRDQMNYVDSLTRLSAHEEEIFPSSEMDTATIQPKGKEFVKVSKTEHIAPDHFNTLRSRKKDQFIRAILDEEVKVYPGSRVRIRLMDDIHVGDQLLEKGNYLFGTVTAFKPQRIEISISSILVDDLIRNVDLRIYDNDGLPGLYVPASQFREFTKDLTSNMANGQNLSFGSNPENGSEFLYSMAEKAYSTASRATGNAAKKNKAKLKYNTILYLVNPDDLK